MLCGGAAEKRFALPNAKIMIHQGSAGFQGTPADIEIHAKEVLSLRRRMAEIISHHTNVDVSQVEKDIDRDRFMTAQDARDYGIIDGIVDSRAAAEKSSALIQGEPARLAEAEAEADAGQPET